jgi:hypothetical protein
VKKSKKVGSINTGSSGVTTATKRKLASLSGNLCADPDCHARLVDSKADVDIGEVAHIVGEKEGAARFDSKVSVPQRNGISNLLYLCANCHTRIDSDKDGVHYSVRLLLLCS